MSDSPPPATTPPRRFMTLRKIAAAILDFIMCFAVGGYVIGFLTGGLTDNGFKLEGWSALLLFAGIVAYFVVFTKYLGGTLWQKTLGVR